MNSTAHETGTDKISKNMYRNASITAKVGAGKESIWILFDTWDVIAPCMTYMYYSVYTLSMDAALCRKDSILQGRFFVSTMSPT